MKNYKFIFFLLLFVAASSIAAQAQQVFVANLSGAQEVPAVTTSGKGICKVVLNLAQTQITVNCTYSGLSSSANAAHIHGSAVVGANAPVLFNFGTVSGTSGTISNQTFTVTAQQVADMRQNRFYVNVHTANNSNGEIRGQLHVANSTFNDFDGDGCTDITVYRSSNGFWYSKSSLTGNLLSQQFGTSSDIVVSNLDFDGDGISDYAFARIDTTNGQVSFNIRQSLTGTVRTQQLGNVALGDSIASGDYDGDGAMDLGIFRNGLWTYIESGTGTTKTFNWGQAGDLTFPKTGDFDGDGKSDFTVIRVVNGVNVIYIRLSSTGQTRALTYGLSTDSPVAPFDFDGDGIQDIAVIRAVNGARVFYILRSSDGQIATSTWGLTSDLFRLGDFDGDGKNDLVAVRNQSGAAYWYINQSSNGFRAEQWGQTNDQ